MRFVALFRNSTHLGLMRTIRPASGISSSTPYEPDLNVCVLMIVADENSWRDATTVADRSSGSDVFGGRPLVSTGPAGVSAGLGGSQVEQNMLRAMTTSASLDASGFCGAIGFRGRRARLGPPPSPPRFGAAVAVGGRGAPARRSTLPPTGA